MRTRMKKEGFYRKLFLIAALWNWVAGVPFLFFYGPILQMLGENVPEPPLYLLITAVLLVLFGWGFYLVYLNLEKNRDFVKMGAIGKLLVFSIALAFAIKGDIQWASMGLFFVDPVFAVFFIEFLYSTRPSATTEGLSASNPIE